MKVQRYGKKLTNFPWDIFEDGIPSQVRFETEADANVAYRNWQLRRAE